MARHEYAIRFDPPDHGDRVPLEDYARALLALSGALASSRFVIATRIAKATGRTTQSVRDALSIHVRTPRHGSHLVPVEIQRRADALKLDEDIADQFWVMNANHVQLAAEGQESDLTATAAERYAEAGDALGDSGTRLELTSRMAAADSSWIAALELTALAPRLRAYAARRRERATQDAQIMGRLVGLSFEPLRVQIAMDHGRVWVMLPRALRAAAMDLADTYVILGVRGEVSREGSDLRELVATDIGSLAVTTELAKEFRSTRGAAGEGWSSADADQYFDDLRRKPSD